LTARVLESKDTTASVEHELLEYIQQYVPKGEGYLAGNSVHFDKEFMKIEFPSVIEYLRYRIIGNPPFKHPFLVVVDFGRCLKYQGLLQDVGSGDDQGDATEEV
jgi:hypothetical protein